MAHVEYGAALSSFLQDLKMQMRPRYSSGLADAADIDSSLHPVSLLYENL